MERTRKIYPPIILLIVLFGLALPGNWASAAIVPCRTDPIFVLSNGDILSVDVEINADIADVKSLMYAVHVPVGVKVKKVIYIGDDLRDKETYRIYQDSPAQTYTTVTVVTLQDSGSVPVTATTTLNKTYANSASGYSGQSLIVTVSEP